MNPLLIGPLLDLGKSILDRVLPDPAKRAEAELELLKLTGEQEFRQALAQLEINAKEAQHASVYVAGWRPGAGWVSVAGFGYATLLQPLLAWVAGIRGWPVPPTIEPELLLYVLGGLLGLAGLRTYERKQAVERSNL